MNHATHPARRTFLALAAAAALAGPALAQAQTIKIAILQELSGAGASAGTNAKNGAEMAIKEINAAGGIWARRSSGRPATHSPTPAWPRAWRPRRWTTMCSP